MYIHTYAYDIYVYVQHDAYESDVLRASRPHMRYQYVYIYMCIYICKYI